MPTPGEPENRLLAYKLVSSDRTVARRRNFVNENFAIHGAMAGRVHRQRLVPSKGSILSHLQPSIPLPKTDRGAGWR